MNCCKILSTLFVWLLLCSSSKIIGQSVSGRILNADTKPVSNASVLLLSVKDSSLVKGATTNNEGNFFLEKLSPGNYFVVCSYTGYDDHYIPSFNLRQESLNLGQITLVSAKAQLKNVTVTGKKPMFEQKIDRMVINVKNSITSTGGTVLDVLEKSPGVIVNRSGGTIALNGKDGVMVMINGKMNYMPQDAVVQMLNGLNASSVEKIELITTPPAKYDAGGNAGYINIVLSTNPDEGFNGSYSLTMGVGHGTAPNASANFNYRKKSLNLYGAYSFSRLAQLQQFGGSRRVIYQGNTKENSIISDRDPYQRNHNARLGMDYKLGKKTVIGALVAGYDNKWSMDAVNHSNNFTNSVLDTVITINNSEINHWKHLMGNVNLQHTFKEGEELSFNADYLYYHNDNPTQYENYYADGNGDSLFTENTTSGKVTVIKLFVSQIDYSKKLNDKTNIELGAKASFSQFTNDVLVQKEVQGEWVPDPKFTGNYFLKENIGALYASMDRKLGSKTNLKAGLRYEYTTSNLGSETEKDIVDRKYGKLFPTFYISHKLNDNNSFNFSYNRRINRPSFTQLAPFLIFFDPKSFISGNSALQPGIMDAVKFDYLLKRFVFTTSYSYESNAISRFQTDVDSTDNTQTVTSQNLDYSQLFYISASLPVKITPWWFSQINVSGNWSKIRAVVKGEKEDFSQFYVNLSGSESFTLPKKFSIELSGFFQSKALLFGASTVDAFGSLNAAIQKKFKDNTSSLTFGVDNIFSTLKIKTSFSVPSQNFETKGSFIFTYPLFKLTWSQKFGNKILKDKRSRSTASEDERKRVDN